MQDAPLPTLLWDMMQTENAITVNQLIKIGPNIVDARYVAASPKALVFYGYTDAHAFSQTWRSLTEPFEYLTAAVRVSAARLEDQSVPVRYITQLRRPNETEFPVIKETRQIYYDGILYWITSLHPAYEEPDVHDVRLLANRLPHSSETRPFGGYSIAEINKLLRALDREQEKILISDFDRSTIVPDLSIEEENLEAAPSAVEKRMVEVARTDEEGKLSCLRCGHRWVPSVPYPKLCSSCNQPWDKPRVRRPYQKRKGKKNN